MRSRVWCCLLALVCCLVYGGGGAWAETQRRTMFFFDTFDTLITIIGYSEDQETFDRVTEQAQERFAELHRYYDAYREYPGIQNIYTINRDAGIAPVEVSSELIDLLAFVKEWQPRLKGTVNIAMGGVLGIWHDYRTKGMDDEANAVLPEMEALRVAANHQDLDTVILDAVNGTVFLSDPMVRLDVGAVAKGYATELVAQWMLSSDMPHFIINAGGNVRAGLPPLDGRAYWGVGIQDPETALGLAGREATVEVVYLANRSVVTSGDYFRFFIVNGVRYHHLISPQTLMPAMENRAVSIVCEDSGVADIVSTAVFILSYEEGLELVESLDGVEALWVRANSEVSMTEGMRNMSKSGGGNGQ